MKAGVTSFPQIGEVLAITLSQNTNLPEGTPTNAKINLIQLAESRKGNQEDNPFQVSTSSVAQLIDAFKELQELQSSISDNPSSTDAADIMIFVLPVVESVIKKLDLPSKELNRAMDFRNKDFLTQIIMTTGPRCILSLEDAVTVLRSLAQTVSTGNTRKEPEKELQIAVKRTIQSLFGSLNNDFARKSSKRNSHQQNGRDQNQNGKRSRQNETSDSRSGHSKKKS